MEAQSHHWESSSAALHLRFLLVFFACVCFGGGGGRHVCTVFRLRSEGSLWELVRPFQHVGPGHHIQVIRLGV